MVLCRECREPHVCNGYGLCRITGRYPVSPEEAARAAEEPHAVIYLSHGAPKFPADHDWRADARRLGREPTSEEMRDAMVAGDWFVVEPRQDPDVQVQSLTRADRRVLRVDVTAGTAEVVNEGRWKTRELVSPLALQPPQIDMLMEDMLEALESLGPGDDEIREDIANVLQRAVRVGR